MKADLAIYSLIVGMSRQWENVATMLSIKLDFCCCNNSVGFCKSSHICCVCCVCMLREFRVDEVKNSVVCFTVVLEQMESIFEHTKSFKRGHGASRR